MFLYELTMFYSFQKLNICDIFDFEVILNDLSSLNSYT